MLFPRQGSRMDCRCMHKTRLLPDRQGNLENRMYTYARTQRSAREDVCAKAWSAICELLGGESRIAEDSGTWNDAFIVNLGTPEMEGKWPYPSELQGWHVDGDFLFIFSIRRSRGCWSFLCSVISRNMGVERWFVPIR